LTSLQEQYVWERVKDQFENIPLKTGYTNYLSLEFEQSIGLSPALGKDLKMNNIDCRSIRENRDFDFDQLHWQKPGGI